MYLHCFSVFSSHMAAISQNCEIGEGGREAQKQLRRTKDVGSYSRKKSHATLE